MEYTNEQKQEQISIVVELLEHSGLNNHKWATKREILEGGLWAHVHKERILRVFSKRAARQLHPSQKQPGSSTQSSLCLLNQLLHNIGASRIRSRRIGRMVHGTYISEDLYNFGGSL